MQFIDYKQFTETRKIVSYKEQYFENAYMKCFTVFVSTDQYNCIGSGVDVNAAKQACVKHAINIEELLPTVNKFISDTEIRFNYRQQPINKFLGELLSGIYDEVLYTR